MHCRHFFKANIFSPTFLLLQLKGFGKKFYLLASLVLHEIGQEDLMLKPVSPLIALIEDHVKEAERLGLECTTKL